MTLNDVALLRWRDNLSNLIARDAKKQMGGAEFGDLMMNTLESGRAGFKKYMGELYGSFDDLVKTETREVLLSKAVPSSIVDEQGKAVLRAQTEKVVQELRPVDASPLKQTAADLSVRLQKSANLGKSEFGGVTIDKVLQLDDALSFSVAQDVKVHFIGAGSSSKRGSAKINWQGL